MIIAIQHKNIDNGKVELEIYDHVKRLEYEDQHENGTWLHMTTWGAKEDERFSVEIDWYYDTIVVQD